MIISRDRNDLYFITQPGTYIQSFALSNECAFRKKSWQKIKKKHFTCETCGDFQLILTQMFALIFFMTHSMAVKASERRGDYQQVRKTE